MGLGHETLVSPGSETTHFVPCMTTFITVYVYHLSVLFLGALLLAVFFFVGFGAEFSTGILANNSLKISDVIRMHASQLSKIPALYWEALHQKLQYEMNSLDAM